MQILKVEALLRYTAAEAGNTTGAAAAEEGKGQELGDTDLQGTCTRRVTQCALLPRSWGLSAIAALKHSVAAATATFIWVNNRFHS